MKPVSDRRQAWEPRESEDDESGRCSLAQHSHLSPMQKKKTCKEVYWEVMVAAASCQESCFGRAMRERERRERNQNVLDRERVRKRVSQFVM
jgi:hypothetical protein